MHIAYDFADQPIIAEDGSSSFKRAPTAKAGSSPDKNQWPEGHCSLPSANKNRA
jgi:hypothetical protein